MMRKGRYLALLSAFLLFTSLQIMAQSTTASISGRVADEQQASIHNASVTARNVETNKTRTAQTNDEGRYRFESLPVGSYEVTVEAQGFAKYVQSGITLLLNQAAVVDVAMKVGNVQEVITVTENASLLNTATAEVGTRFDSRRVSELPLSTNRNVYNIALSAPGVSQLGSGQTSFAGGGTGSTSGISFSANGGRIRSNNFMIDGQDNNDFGVAGATIPLNNPDAIQEVRLVTNQFSAEYGRNSSAVFNAITKSGANDWHGSAFWFHNDNALNACSNTNKAGGFCNPNATDPSRRGAPFRIENQLGGTIGGPLHLPRFGEGGPSFINGKDRTFFFFSVQRWWDRQLGVGTTLNGAPTEAGRQILSAAAGDMPQVQALLRFLPAAQTPINRSAIFERNGQRFTVPLGSLTGSQPSAFNDWQTSFRLDHKLSEKHNVNGRYLYQDNDTLGGPASQITPPGFSSAIVARSQGLNFGLTSVPRSNLVNEARAAYLRYAAQTRALDASAEQIPSIEIVELGLRQFNAAATRTGIGLGVNLPQQSVRNTYQLQDTISYTTGNHGLKFGADIRRNQLHQLFKPTTRGLVEYATLDFFVKDLATRFNINKDLPGVARILHLDWHDFYFFAQDEWKVRPNFTLSLGLRYENPGQPIQDLANFNAPVLAAAGNDPRFRLTPIPGRDSDNFQPRLGFNWNPRTEEGSFFNFLTGGDKLVFRGGYTRTHDYAFTNIALNIWSSFPFVAAVSSIPTINAVDINAAPGAPLVRVSQNAFALLSNPPFNPNTLNRTIVDEGFRTPSYDSFSLEMQRELSNDLVLRVGYVGTKGNGLFESVDANPTIIGCTAPSAANNFCRSIPNQGPTRLRTNSGSSIYHSLQTSLDRRLSRGFSAGLHYTWSTFIDTQSEIFNISSGEIAVAQDSYCRSCDRGRSSFDRPHRLTGNFVYELPFFREQKGFVGHLLGGWQTNAFFTLQSGSPFTPLNGSDPTGALASISGLVGNSIRPNLNTTLDLSRMTVEEIVAAGGRTLFRGLSTGQRVGNAGRNILRSDGINNIDFGILKNTRLGEGQRLQVRADFFNLTNTRDFGIPDSTITSTNFLNQWGTNGGNRRVIVGLRYVF